MEKNPLPKRLAVFTSKQWPGRTESDRMSAWSEARRDWADAHKLDSLPGDDAIRIPDEPWDEDLI